MATDQVDCWLCQNGHLQLVIGERGHLRTHCDRCGAEIALNDKELHRQVASQHRIDTVAEALEPDDLVPAVHAAAQRAGLIGGAGEPERCAHQWPGDGITGPSRCTRYQRHSGPHLRP